MLKVRNQIVGEVDGPLGKKLTLDKLPEPRTSRWVARRKAEVVAAIEGGLLGVHEACARYELSMEELVSWQRAVERDGMVGLRASNAQQNRQHERLDRRQEIA